MEAWARVIRMAVMVSSHEICEGEQTKFADELGVTLRDRKSEMNSCFLASIDGRLLKLDKGIK